MLTLAAVLLATIVSAPDRLELRVITDAAGRTRENGSILVWERVRP